ncbi:MAG TPA: DUF4126 domain-containing protein [Streptosporangiaceae bacterium]|nr:DUF4126 domain-containing protein [Streptosporangiaceae bacterium]
MSAVPLIFSSGWASGINSYAVVLLLGLLGRYAHMSSVPPTLERTDVLAVCAVLFLGQFVLGKIPYVNSVWDAIHTAIRPLMGAAVGALMAGHAHTLPQAAAAAIGGGTALATHLVKSGIRVGVNASPEPVSNVVASLAEDLSVAGLVVLALLHPLVAALIAAALLVLGIILVIMSAKRIRRAWRRRRERRRQRQAGQLSRAPL